MKVPLRVDLAGGWLDVPTFSRPGAYIVNCAIEPMVSLDAWPYETESGLGGSAAFAALKGEDPIASELRTVGWQDPAVIMETGLCVWRSGTYPVLEAKYNPDWLTGRLLLIHTGQRHITANLLNLPRNFDKIADAGMVAAHAAAVHSLNGIAAAINLSYKQQVEEGMKALNLVGCGLMAYKYCGGGHGGYVVCLFNSALDRSKFCVATEYKPFLIEPYMRPL